MANLSLKLPILNRPGMKAGEKIDALNEYLMAMDKQLRYVLCNLDEENLSSELMEALQPKPVEIMPVQQPAEQLTKDELLSMVYPVGSIYISMASVSPADLFGGEWAALEGKFLLGASSAYVAGTTGGEESHQLTMEEMPAHNHGLKIESNTLAGGSQFARLSSTGSPLGTLIDEAGSGLPHNNMPPYIAVHMWQRTA